jgi:hypothetical protein
MAVSPKDKIDHFLPKIISYLASKGIEERFLQFGGEDEEKEKPPRVPTDANSEFLANRAMGDWAENILSDAISQSDKYKISHYGNSESMSAGEDGFKEYYLSALEEVRLYGKRPDLLLFEKNIEAPTDLTKLKVSESDCYVKKAIAAIEVRSSKFEAQTYIRVRQKEKEDGKTGANETPSFTVKVEDLRIVYRWIERQNISQSYCQVFFDSVYAINIVKIFELIASAKENKLKIDTPLKSQLKTTIMIPITFGELVGSFSKLPSFGVENKITRLGRHDAYVKPIGGDLKIDTTKLIKVLVES